jgi:hypothetical protein
MSIDLSQVATALTTIGTLAGTAYATLPLLLWSKKLNLDTLHTVATVCQQVVAGIEQTQSGQSSATKKQAALSAVQSILSTLKVSVPAPFIDAALEAAVLALPTSSASTSSTATGSSATVGLSSPVADGSSLAGGSSPSTGQAAGAG